MKIAALVPHFRRSTRHQIATLAALTLVWGGVAKGQTKQPSGQTKQPSRAELLAEIAVLHTALADCQAAKELLGRERAKLNSIRDDAIASLRAVRSALNTGANLEEFKKYQIESRIKVDALPIVPENRDIRDISDLYREAITFSVINVGGGKILADDLTAARERHRGDAIDAALEKMTTEESAKQYASTFRTAGTEERVLEKIHQNNALYAKNITQILMVNADEKLSKLK